MVSRSGSVRIVSSSTRGILTFQDLQSVYPSRMFAWENFLRACSTCNIAKGDEFPLHPTGGRPFMEPCEDDPLDFFEWDLLTGATGLNSQPDRFSLASNTRDIIDLDRESIKKGVALKR